MSDRPVVLCIVIFYWRVSIYSYPQNLLDLCKSAHPVINTKASTYIRCAFL